MIRPFTAALALCLPLLVPQAASANSDSESVRHHSRSSARATDRGLVGLDVNAGHKQDVVPFRGDFLDSRELSLSKYYKKASAKPDSKASKKRQRIASKSKKRRGKAQPASQDASFDALSCLDGFGGEAHATPAKSTPKKQVTASSATGTQRRVSRGLRVPVRPGM